MRNKVKEILIALFFIVFPLIIGFVSSYFAPNTKEAYSILIRPPLSPPSIVFPIMWTILYLMMGVASYIAYNNNNNIIITKKALRYYSLQLFVNCFWSLFFFGLDWRLFAFVWLVLLWGLILITMIYFKKISKHAYYLMVPYLLWVSFAGYLNIGFYLLNR